MRPIATLTALLLCICCLAAEPGLLFHATFDDTLDAFSLSGQGTPAGVDGPPPAFAPGRFGEALVSGVGQTLVQYHAPGNVVPRCGTVSLWICPQNWTPDDPNFHVFFESGPPNGGLGWLIFYKYYQEGRLLLRFADEKQSVGMASAGDLGWRPGEWHHIAGAWSDAALRIYVDGKEVARAPQPLVADTLGDTFTLGDNGWHVPHEGARTLVDDVRIYAYPLPAAAIRRLAGGTEVTVSRAAGGAEWLLDASAEGLAEAQRADFEIAAAGGGEALKSVQAPVADGHARATVAVTDLAPGKYLVRAAVLSADRTRLAQGETPMTRLHHERFELANEHMVVQFDGGTGGIVSIADKERGFSCRPPEVVPVPLFSLDTVSFASYARFYPTNAVVPIAAHADFLQSASVTREGNEQRYVAEYLFPPGVKATLTAVLADASPAVALRLRLENVAPLRPSEAIRIPRVSFPMLSGLRIGSDPAANSLATGRIHGEVQANPAAALPTERTLQYPGSACLPWQDLYGPSGGLWLGPQADASTQLEIITGAERGLVSLGNRWWCLLEPGDTWESPVVELAVHGGAWHWGAERFRDWALKNTPPRQQPAWLDQCHGWTGFGGPSYKFAELPQVMETAQYYGFNYLQIWAQMILGGAYYSYFYPNPDLGTIEDLKAGLAGVHAMGGHVGFYSNAICFDGAVDQNPALRETIEKYKLTDMPPIPRFYGEAERSVFVGPQGVFGRGGASGHSHSGYPDGYWAMDPCSPWWQDYLATWIARWHDDYGADVWYLDSFPVHGYGLGPASYSLHLDKPMSLGAGQLALLKRIRQSFAGPMLYEGVCCAAFMPYTNWCLGTEFAFGYGTWSCPEIFCYSFSDVYPVFSGTCNTWQGIGAIWPDLKTPRHEDALNHVFLTGERFDILGLHGLDRESPFSKHVKALVTLRAKIAEVVYKGRMMERLGLSGMPAAVEARVFVRQGPAGAVVTVVDRRPEKAPWELTLDTRALPWPQGLKTATWLGLDGGEERLEFTAENGVLRVPMKAAEVAAVRFGG